MRKFRVSTKKHQRKGRTKHTRKQHGYGVGASRERPTEDVNRIPYLEVTTKAEARQAFGPPVEDLGGPNMLNIPSHRGQVKKLWSVTDPTGRSIANTRYTFINCADNQLTQLPDLPNTLQGLNCADNQLTQLPDLPNTLQGLKCNNNQLTQLPTLPNMLIDMNCNNNLLTQLPQLPINLEYLKCQNNKLTLLPNLPNSTLVLNVDNNLLTQLPNLPDSIIYLYCSSNQLTQLPNLRDGLRYLECKNNQLTQLPPLNNLRDLNCDNNQLTELPNLPFNLQTLNCANNLLSQLPDLPQRLGYLNCANNQLTQLPNLPFNLQSLKCANNPLTVLPILPNEEYVLGLSFDQAELLNNIRIIPGVCITVVDSNSYDNIDDDKFRRCNQKWRELKSRGDIEVIINAPIAKSKMRSALDRAIFNLATRNREHVKGSNANMSNLPEDMLGEIRSNLGGRRRKRRRTRKHKK